MTFAAPLFLVAMLAGAIPVVLHLIHRRHTRQIRFSTLRFLRQSVQRTRRRRYLNEFTLLALRVSVLVLIAAGLAEPAIRHWQGLFGQGSSLAAAIILDNSASMALVDDGRPRFDTAKQAVEGVLATMRPGDSVALFLTGGAEDAAQEHLFSAHEAVRQKLAQARVSYEGAGLAARLREARTLLTQAPPQQKEIYIITDNQAISWDGLNEAPEQAAEPSREIPVVVIDVHRSPQLNVALRTLSLAAPAPVTGVPIQVSVELWNTSPIVQQKHVELRVDGKSLSLSPTLILPAGAKVKQAFRFTLDRAGLHQGEVRLVESDGSAFDNRLFFALSVNEQIPVAIVKPSAAEASPSDEAFYLERAFNLGNSSEGAIRASLLIPASLASEPLAHYAAIFCVGLPALDSRPAEQLLSYVRAGGHLVWVCGRNTDPAAYNGMNDRSRGLLLPALLSPVRTATGQVESWRIGSLDQEYPALAPLAEPASLFQSVLIYKHYPMVWDAHSDARVLARLEDDQPLLAERRVGSGSVLLLGTALHVNWTNWPLKPLFLPFVSRLTFHFVGAEIDRNQVRAGAAIEVPITPSDGRGEIEVVRPTGETLRLNPPQPGLRSLRYGDTHDAGIYVVRLVNDRNAPSRTFAVNPDPNEADPATFTADELKSRFGREPFVLCPATANVPETIRRLREGASLGQWFLAAVLVALVCEALVANRAPSQTAPPVEQPAIPAGPLLPLSVGEEFLASLPDL